MTGCEASQETFFSVSDAVAARRSVRAFLGRSVATDLIVDLLERAARAPSGGNLQPWRVNLVTGRSLSHLLETMALRTAELPQGETPQFEIYPAELGDVFRSRRSTVGEAMYGLLGIPRADRAARRSWFERNYQFFGAPAGLFIHIHRSMGSPQWADLGMFIQTFLLLAAEAGLGTCAQESWALYPDTVGRFLQTSAEELLFCGIAVGYEDQAHVVNGLRTERALAADFVTVHD